ncbi:adenosylmethionine decarboxylase [Gracilaria domingensis]|nr:adenosylmethionine decarboxylase [Gracilaria domingensis]
MQQARYAALFGHGETVVGADELLTMVVAKVGHAVFVQVEHVNVQRGAMLTVLIALGARKSRMIQIPVASSLHKLFKAHAARFQRGVDERHFVLKAVVRKHLRLRKPVAHARKRQRLGDQMQRRSGVEDVRKRVEQSSGAAGLDDKQVVGDKQGRLGQQVGVKMGVAADRQHGATRALQNEVNSSARHGAQGGAGVIAVRAKAHAKLFLGALEGRGTGSRRHGQKEVSSKVRSGEEAVDRRWSREAAAAAQERAGMDGDVYVRGWSSAEGGAGSTDGGAPSGQDTVRE